MPIREAAKKDLDALVKLEIAAFQKDAFNRRQIRYLLTKAKSTILVLYKNKELAGAAYLAWHKQRTNGRIYNIVVSSKFRGQGLGARLLKECERLCQKRRCRFVSLEVRTENKAAIAFYKKHGFETVAKLPKYYADSTAGFKMKKSLN